ncbi:MFS transporter [Devosia sp. A369]
MLTDDLRPLSTFSPLKNLDFRLLWLTMLVANLGGLMQAVAAGWVMTTLTTSAEMIALVQTATTLPIMLLSLGAGALADNYNRRMILLSAQFLMLVSAGALAVSAQLGLVTPWLLLVFTFVTGSGTALHYPSWQASIGDVLQRREIPGAVTLNAMSFNLMRTIGPAVGGFVLVYVGSTVLFLITALCYIPMIVALLRWKPNYPVRALPRETLPTAIRAGLRYVLMSSNILTVMLRAFLFGFSAIAVLALLPLIASQMLAGGPMTYGALLGCFGLGGAAGAVLNVRLRARFSNEAIVRTGCLIIALAFVGLAFSGNAAVSCLMLLPIGASWVALMSMFNGVIQLFTPRWVVGRVMACYQTAAFGGMALGSWAWGGVANNYGPTATLIGAAALLLVCAIAGLRLAIPAFSSFDLSPLDRFREPDLPLALQPRAGPIMVMVEYIITRQDVPAFLSVMTQRRHIRLRDGARQWTLLRDLENPQLWTETYHVATWVEYVRHNQRRTRADAEVSDSLLRLHRQAEAPKVRRLIEHHNVPPRDELHFKPGVDAP